MYLRNLAYAVIGLVVIVLIIVIASMAMRPDAQGNVVLESGTTSTFPQGTSSVPMTTSTVTTPNTTSPAPQPVGKPVTISTTLGQSVSALNMTVTPLAVVSDSRCPRDAVCVWAGTVTVKVRLTSALGTSEQVIELGGTMTTEAESVKLVGVSERASSNEDTASYKFTFEVARR